MAQLTAPGVSVTVIDESFYTPGVPGTIPLIIIATHGNKINGSGTGIAPGTLAANSGKVYLLTSQKDSSDTFGTPLFQTDANNNPVHAGELNEYGLQAAYSLLGVSNRAYVVRAPIDLGELSPTPIEPTGEPRDGDWWLDTGNTKYGIFEWNAAAATVGGQTFSVQTPRVLTTLSQLVNVADQGDPDPKYAPKSSIGAVGEYAVIAYTNLMTVWYKKRQTNTSVAWVQVGSQAWRMSRPIIQGTKTAGAVANTKTVIISGITFTPATGETLTPAQLVALINAHDFAPASIKAEVINTKLEIYFDGGTSGSSALAISGTALTDLGLVEGTYNPVKLQISKHTSVPSWKTSTVYPIASTGSIWVKTSNINMGADWFIKEFNGNTNSWVRKPAPLYASSIDALLGIDANGGGRNLTVSNTYVQYNNTSVTPGVVDFKIYTRRTNGATTINSIPITGAAAFKDKTLRFNIQETQRNRANWFPATVGSNMMISVSFTDGTDNAEVLATAINAAVDSTGVGLSNIVASVNGDNTITITHLLGGDVLITEAATNLNTDIAYSVIFPESPTNNFKPYPATATGELRSLGTLWTAVDDNNAGFIEPSITEPRNLTEDGKLWYSSIVDEVDLLINTTSGWAGYKSSTSPYNGVAVDSNGPIISATIPTRHSATSTTPNLVDGDIWISTADLENYPLIYRYENGSWVLLDTSDQTTENGVLFADARWTAIGNVASDPLYDGAPSSIVELMASNYVDFDCPDPTLYPVGMLLWNTRRSGFNVKMFIQNYVDVNLVNPRIDDSPGVSQPQTNYYPHRWVTQSPNQTNGAGSFGRFAQRSVVIKALQGLVNSNQDLRDEESRRFNLIACPGYPELVSEMIGLNADRGLTAFVIGDPPARLLPNATSLSDWGTNLYGALEDNDRGLVSYDEYAAFFYPWGYTSDNLGNNIVVPPSHMMLRTIALSDSVSYPWFAPAGTRRGVISGASASAVGYVTPEGEFSSVSLNSGQCSTLQQLCKVNPITYIEGTGLTNYGNLTRARNASALDRINVARLIVYLRRQLEQLAKPYVFEPNDKITRDELKNATETLLLELVGLRAIYDYVVVCDTSNNTPARIDRNELWLDIAIEPVKAVEFIYIPLRLKNTGEIKGLTNTNTGVV